MNVSPYGLLLEDVMGHRRNTLGNYSKILVFKGSLLQTSVNHDELITSLTDPPHNYRTLAEPAESAILFCHSDQICNLTTVQKDLLLGIQDLSDRLGVIDKLSWGESLKIGCSVHVTIPSHSLIKATVQFIGEVKGVNGRIFGLKLKVCICVVTL